MDFVETGKIDWTPTKKANEAMEELWDFCENDRFIKEDLEHHKIGRKELEELYDTLARSTAGRWAKGHYVIVNIFFYSYTLDYCLNRKKLGISDYEMVLRCVEWFEKGQGGTHNSILEIALNENLSYKIPSTRNIPETFLGSCLNVPGVFLG